MDRWTDYPDKLYAATSGGLCVIDQLVLRGSRILMPGKFRRQALVLAHEGHLRIACTKKALRTSVVASQRQIMQIVPWVPASGTTRRTRTNKVNHLSSGTVDERRRQPTWSATVWTLNTSCA